MGGGDFLILNKSIVSEEPKYFEHSKHHGGFGEHDGQNGYWKMR